MNKKMSNWRDMVFDAIPTDMVRSLWELAPDEWKERTEISVGQYVWTPVSGETELPDEVMSVIVRDGVRYARTENGLFPCSELEQEWDAIPGWRWMWKPRESALSDILEHIELVSKIGFRVIEHRRFGVFIGLSVLTAEDADRCWTDLYNRFAMERWGQTAKAMLSNGDRVWFVNRTAGEVEEAVVDGVQISDVLRRVTRFELDFTPSTGMLAGKHAVFKGVAIGRNVFTDRAEAVAALGR